MSSIVTLRAILFATLLMAGALTAAAQSTRPMSRLPVDGGEIEYEVSGSGEPVLLIHGTGVAATFYPLMSEPALSRYRLIRVHRRGFAGSSRTPVPFTIKDHAADARAVLAALGVQRAHVVGHSFGGMVALQLALDAPDLVASLVVMEPPIFNAASPPRSFLEMEASYRAGNKEAVMERFSTASYGAEWRSLAARVPGGPEQVMRDVDTVFQTEVQAMIGWGFGEAQAKAIKQPIIYATGGGGHGASLNQLRGWIPSIESVIVPGVTHAMLMQDPKAVAEAIAPFLARHPL